VTGACAQIAANVAAGLSHGVVGAVIAGWPALVACGCFELLLRHRRETPASGPVAPVADHPAPAAADTTCGIPDTLPPAEWPAPDPAITRARELYADGLQAGRAPPIRAIKRDLHVGSRRATHIQAALAAPCAPSAQAA
jgi:hypothetical protein